MKVNSSETIKLLTSYIVNNSQLEKVESHLHTFNPLKVLKLNHYEIRHSNVLGWLLDPNENHNLRDTILKKFILDILTQSDNESKEKPENINEANILLTNLLDMEVNREYKVGTGSSQRSIDVLAVSHTSKIILLIENKVYAGEGQDQLTFYLNHILEEYPDYSILPVYLTLFGDEPSDNRYFMYSYVNLYQLIDDTLSVQQPFMHGKVLEFIKDYLLIIKELTSSDSEYVDLCEDIYKEHSKAINLIINEKLEKVENPQIRELIRRYKDVSQFIKSNGEVDYSEVAFHRFIENHPELTFSPRYKYGKIAYFFYPKDYHLIPDFSGLTHQSWPYCEFPVPFIFDKGEDFLSLKMEVGKFDAEHLEIRKGFLEHLKNQTNVFGNKSKLSDNITMLIKIKKRVEEKIWQDTESILNAMNELYESYKSDHFPEIYEGIKEYWGNGDIHVQENDE
ncbi:PDDEXK-like family protein [Neobacillus sp. Marseille-QA0830]